MKKKLLTMLLCAAMLATSTVTAIAAETLDEKNSTASIPVKGNYKSSNSGATVNVTVSWDDMTFTYQDASTGTWNPTNHQYDDPVAAGWKDESKTITVTNHSDTDISATFSFSGVNGIKGNFTKDSLELVSANIAPYKGTTNAPSDTTEFSIDTSSPAISADNTNLGTITVTIAAVS